MRNMKSEKTGNNIMKKLKPIKIDYNTGLENTNLVWLIFSDGSKIIESEANAKRILKGKKNEYKKT